MWLQPFKPQCSILCNCLWTALGGGRGEAFPGFILGSSKFWSSPGAPFATVAGKKKKRNKIKRDKTANFTSFRNKTFGVSAKPAAVKKPQQSSAALAAGGGGSASDSG